MFREFRWSRFFAILAAWTLANALAWFGVWE
jgi:hypothetical protein